MSVWVKSIGAAGSASIKFTVDDVVIHERVLSEHEMVDSGRAPKFSIDLRTLCDFNSASRVEARFAGSGEHLAGSPWRINHTPSAVPFALLHIPKTAGTSLRISLEDSFGQHAVLPSTSYLRQRGGQYLTASELQLAIAGCGRDLLLVQGHMSLWQLKNISPAAEVLTLLRDPVARVTSLLKHIKVRRAPELSYEAMLAPKGVANGAAKNHQTKLLSGLPPDASINRHLNAARKNLDVISLAGITERFEDSLLLCSHVLKRDLGAPRRLNKAPPHAEPIPDSLMEQIWDWNRADQVLYAQALEAFNDRLRGIKGNDS